MLSPTKMSFGILMQWLKFTYDLQLLGSGRCGMRGYTSVSFLFRMDGGDHLVEYLGISLADIALYSSCMVLPIRVVCF